MPQMTAQIEHTLDAETDARFWAQYGFRPGKKLDPSSLIDRAFVPAWQDIRKKVTAEWAAGKLVTTHDHPVVQSLIAQAHDLFDTAADSLGKALTAVDPRDRAAHAAAGVNAHNAANAATSKAATYQPPTASPQLAHQAAADIAATISPSPDPSLAPSPGKIDDIDITLDPPAPAAPQISARDAVDAMQASNAPIQAQATAQAPRASDSAVAAKPDKGNGTAYYVGIGCVLAIGLAITLSDGNIASEQRTIERDYR